MDQNREIYQPRAADSPPDLGAVASRKRARGKINRACGAQFGDMDPQQRTSGTRRFYLLCDVAHGFGYSDF
jgi:hypothetical protein